MTQVFVPAGRFRAALAIKLIFNGSRISSPEYHLTSESTSAVTFVKEIEGDSYTVEIRSRSAQAGTILEAQFVAAPD